MNKAFWTLTDSIERWAENSGANPLVFDTSHGTNKYSLKFAAFGTIDKHGKTQALSCSLLDRETEEALSWVFTEFLRQQPNIIITAGDPVMAAAIKTVFPCIVSFALSK